MPKHFCVNHLHAIRFQGPCATPEAASQGGAPPPPPGAPAPPPPPPAAAVAVAAAPAPAGPSAGAVNALLQDINKGTDVTKGKYNFAFFNFPQECLTLGVK